MITDRKFKCSVTSKTLFIKGNLSCDSSNDIYLITCFNCREQYAGLAMNFKQIFRTHKSDIETDPCGIARYFNSKCCSPNNEQGYLKIHIIEQLSIKNQFGIEDLLKHWQAQLCTNLYGMNNFEDLYSMKRKGYQK